MLLQLSSGQGPIECALAVKNALKKLLKEASASQTDVDVLETVSFGDGFRSVVLNLSGNESNALAQKWSGNMLWVCPLRSGQARKNWYFDGVVFEETQQTVLNENDIEFKTCRSSGAGGQHVNTTNSAIQAVHKLSGLSVRVETQRSQHANKKMAIELLRLKVAQQNALSVLNNKSQQRLQHHSLERGNPLRTFIGPSFDEK